MDNFQKQMSELNINKKSPLDIPIPVRCFTCNKVLGHLWRRYEELCEKYPNNYEEILNQLKLDRYCCRRMMLTHLA